MWIPIDSSHVEQVRGRGLPIELGRRHDGAARHVQGEVVVWVPGDDAVADRGFS